ncbi:protein-disulfide reductase [Theileria orientalis]|uniref:Protein-disulfide reductase n=1 Tax=Theileria orientalis TaxID=68886 RepID=A0A976MDE9_THEOR|nr:protein-disulfide reductase [Theileria orientalis]
MAAKLSFIFATLFFLTYTASSQAKISRVGTTTRVVPIYQVASKDAFIRLNRKKTTESSTPTELKECNTKHNVVLSKLLDKKYKKLVLVATGSVVFTLTCYKFVSKLVDYLLYSRYVTKPYPKVADTVGHVLLANTKDSPSATFIDKVVNPVSNLFKKVPLLRGFVRPGMRRVSTASVVDKDTYVVLYFTNDGINERYKMMGVDPSSMLKKSYEALKRNGKKVVIVLVDLSKNFDSSYDFFKGTPYYAVPFGDLRRKRNLQTLFNLIYVPSVVVLDSEGNLVNDRCLNLFYDRINEFPWRNFRFLDVLPDYLVDGDNQPVHKSTLEGKFMGVFLFSGNPDSDKVLKKNLRDMYEYMDKVTEGNFRVLTLNFDKEGQLKSDTEGINPEWLTVNKTDQSYVSAMIEFLNLGLLNRFVLLDSEGREYVSNVNIFNERFYEPIWKEYSRGASRVKGDNMSFAHVLKRPILFVLGDGEDEKALDNLELELNKALAVHESRRTGAKFEILLLRDPKKCETFRKHLKLDKKTKMVSVQVFK